MPKSGDWEMAQKLVKCRKEKGLKQADIAAELKVSEDTVSRWENGTGTPKCNELRGLCLIYNKSSDYFLSLTAESVKENLSRIGSQVIVSVYKNVTPHCGDGTDNSYVEGELEQLLPLPVEYVGEKTPSNLYGLRVEGGSMESAKISDGDIVIIRKCDDWFTPVYGDPCHVQYKRDGFWVDAIKYYYPKRDGSSVMLCSADGPKRDLIFDRDEIQSGNPIILGVVVGVVEYHKPLKGR